jgi:hypothetical protein
MACRSKNKRSNILGCGKRSNDLHADVPSVGEKVTRDFPSIRATSHPGVEILSGRTGILDRVAQDDHKLPVFNEGESACLNKEHK